MLFADALEILEHARAAADHDAVCFGVEFGQAQVGKQFADLGLSKLDPETDRVMICGSPGMLKDLKRICEEHGLSEGNTSTPGAFVIERAFAES